MAFKFATQKLECKLDRQTLVDLVTSYEDAFQAKLEIEEAIGGLEVLDTIWSNINSSIDLLAQYDDKAIPCLNVDKSLEDLMGIAESKITSKLAIASLEDAQQSLWDKFKDYCERLWTAICNMFKAIFGVKGEVARCDQVEAGLAKIDDKTLANVEFPSGETREQSEKEAKDAEEAAKIFLEVDSYATELAAIAAAISFENDSRVDELNAKIKELENKVTVCEGRLDKLDGQKESAPAKPAAASNGPAKMGVLGWTKATLVAWVKTFKKFYVDYCQKAIAAAERARSKSKTTADKLDSLQKAGKTKPKDEKTSKVNGTITAAKTCHNKINKVAQRSSSRVAKHKQKASARVAALQKNALKWSDNYSSDDNPEY